MKYHWYKLILLLFALFFVPACGDFDEEGGESISLSTDVSAFDDIYKTSKYKANDSATRSILKDLGIYDEYSVEKAKYETDTLFH